jgi:UDP-N-acetylglucosamine 2-epimerase
VAHVEAGLRSGRIDLPFPEELNRRAVSLIARWNFAPTQAAAANLRREGVTTDIHVTGNTVVDAVRHIVALPITRASTMEVARPYLLATAHRRESWGAPIERIARALARIHDARPDLSIVFATHPNPLARDPVRAVLDGRDRVRVVDAIDYQSFLGLLEGAVLAISDSGGVQEEGPTLGIPVLVTRDVTERPEGVATGAVRLVGTDEELIVREAIGILEDPQGRSRMATAGRSVYGDGHAASRIVDTILRGLAI